MRITKATYVDVSGLPGVRIEFADLPDAIIIEEFVAKPKGRGWNAVFLGSHFEPLVPSFEVEVDNGELVTGEPPVTVRGHTPAPQVVRIGDQLLADVEAGTWAPGAVVFAG